MTETEKSEQQSSETVTHSSRKAKVVHSKYNGHETIKILLEPDEVVRQQVGGFVNFLREHAVVGVAIGFIIGLQAQTLVKQLVTSFITPLLTLMVGSKLANKQFTVDNSRSHVIFAWGPFVYAVADFLVVLFCIYAIVKLLKLDKLDKPKKKSK